ncbi:hypothetical protein CK203_107933 [Vitis vinifera]|uniref:Uncharacterized protein n=1 Tax=Vitis vinifera TaxID=29760 RepID=A0A438DCS8_VITVI|nr:hypothetical protein CK203_107933 [Vitis vinifera]
MIDTIAEAGSGIKGLTGYQIGNTYLEEEVQELEVKLFVDDQGEFGSALAKKAINQSLLGPHLQKIAVKILSQTCSSSGCERNWSTCGGNRGIGGTGDGIGGDGSIGGGYVSQVDPTCHGHKEMKITMPHKIQIMDINQGHGINESN